MDNRIGVTDRLPGRCFVPWVAGTRILNDQPFDNVSSITSADTLFATLLEGYMEVSLLVPGRKFVVVAGLSPAGEKAAKQRVRIKYSYGANEAKGFGPVN